MSARLALHAGANAVERSALALVPVPARTPTYNPVGHGHFVDVIEDQLDRIGFRFGDQKHGLSKDGARYFGVAELLDGRANARNALTVGMRASLDKSMAPSIAFGSCVFVCDNMAFSGEITLTRKQTTYIARDLPALVHDAVSHVTRMREDQDRRFDWYQGVEISQGDADHAIVNMLRNGVINTSRVEKVVAEWDAPSYDHGAPSVWRLFNATTEALKDSPVAEITRRTIGLQNLCDDISGFRVAA